MKYGKPLAIIVALILVFVASAWVYNRYMNQASANQPASSTTLTDASDGTSVPVEGFNVGDIAYDFTLTSFDGEEITLSDYRGKIVVLNFWGTWCATCLSELHSFQNIQDDMTKSGAEADTVIMAINWAAETRVSYEDTKAYIDENGYTFISLYDNESVAFKLHVYHVPVTIVIDASGVISQIIQGYATQTDLETAIEGARA